MPYITNIKTVMHLLLKNVNIETKFQVYELITTFNKEYGSLSRKTLLPCLLAFYAMYKQYNMIPYNTITNIIFKNITLNDNIIIEYIHKLYMIEHKSVLSVKISLDHYINCWAYLIYIDDVKFISALLDEVIYKLYFINIMINDDTNIEYKSKLRVVKKISTHRWFKKTMDMYMYVAFKCIIHILDNKIETTFIDKYKVNSIIYDNVVMYSEYLHNFIKPDINKQAYLKYIIQYIST